MSILQEGKRKLEGLLYEFADAMSLLNDAELENFEGYTRYVRCFTALMESIIARRKDATT